MAEDKHFVDEHRFELIKRVSNIAPILDELLDKKVIQHKSYDAIRALPASQERMRALFSGPLESSGVQGKEIFYKILKINERDLIDDLEKTDVQVETMTPEGLNPGTKVKYDVDEEQPSLIQRVEAMVSVIELLLDTLADLSDEELDMISEDLSQISLLGHYTVRLPRTNDLQETVFLMVQLNGRMSVEKTMEILNRINRTDLVQRLSHSSSGAKKKHSVDERLSALIHKVASMVAVKYLLLETIMNLSFEEQLDFSLFLQFTFFQRSPLIRWSRPWWRGGESQLAEVVVETYGQQSLEVTMEVFMDMRRTDLVQRLSETSSGPKEKHSVDEHWPALTQKVEAMVSVIELLLETMKYLSGRMFMDVLLSQPDLRRHLLITPVLPLHPSDMKHVVFLMVLTFGQQSVQITTQVLKQMRRTDLVKRLSDSSLEVKKTHSADERHSALIQRVATMAAVKQLLLETLNDLPYWEYKTFRRFLQLIVSQMHLPNVFGPLTDRAVTMDLMVPTYGQLSVEITREVFLAMNRTDLVQRLSVSNSGSKGKHSVDEHRPALLERSAAMAAVKTILWETLKKLSQREFKKFIWLLPYTCFQKSLPQMSWKQMTRPEMTGIVDAMVLTCGQQSVEVTKEVLMDMNRTDLVQTLSQTSPRFTEGHQSQPVHKEVNILLQERLLETLENLSYKEFQKFDRVLQSTAMTKGLPEFQRHRIGMADRVEIVKVMVEIYGIKSEEVIREILKEEKRSTEGKYSVDKLRPALFKKQETMAPLKMILETLKDLSPGELERFRHVLQYSKIKKGLPRIPRQRIEMAGTGEIAMAMVEIYGEESMEVTREVLKMISRGDLVQWLSDISSGSKGPSRSLELEGRGSMMQDSSNWTKLEPEVNSTDADEDPTYSLQSEAGRFECSVSGLRWFCKEKVSFKYQFCSWEEPMERMENMKYMPAGPLIDITVVAGKLDEVYLPHWICIDDIPKMSNKFAVLHIDDCGDVVEKVSEVTPSHVKLREPVFSPRAVLMKVGFPVKISCNVLIYYKPNTPFLKLHVYMIPLDPALQQAVDKKKFSDGYKIIQKPRPDKYLKMQQGFTLTANIDTASIFPEKITLRYDSQDPNFYEVFIENPDRNFYLTLTQKNKRKQQCEPVWRCEIRKDDYQNSAHSEDKYSVDEHLSKKMEEAATITTDRERLSYTLQHLKQEELKEFKWFLQDSDILAGLPCIPPSRLENGDRLDLADLMLQTYSQQSLEVTKKVFKKINRKDLVQML